MVNRVDLESVCMSGLATLHGWTLYARPTLFTVTTRPQRSFLPERIVIQPGTATLWVVHDVIIGTRSQLVAGGPVPAVYFNSNNSALSFDTVYAGMDVRLVVEYIGSKQEGEAFYAVMVGRTDTDGREVLTLTSGGNPIRPSGRRVLLDLGDRYHLFEEHEGTLAASVWSSPPTMGRDDLDVISREIERVQDLTMRPESPMVISLRVARAALWQPTDQVLFGVNEASGWPVFEVGDVHGAFTARCELGGYEPTWWCDIQTDETNA